VPEQPEEVFAIIPQSSSRVRDVGGIGYTLVRQMLRRFDATDCSIPGLAAKRARHPERLTHLFTDDVKKLYQLWMHGFAATPASASKLICLEPLCRKGHFFFFFFFFVPAFGPYPIPLGISPPPS
tara:strand:+ start:67 stop:441 length:375 start_codon:yes stop_codon:yes gene_type:complete